MQFHWHFSVVISGFHCNCTQCCYVVVGKISPSVWLNRHLLSEDVKHIASFAYRPRLSVVHIVVHYNFRDMYTMQQTCSQTTAHFQLEQ